MRKEKKIVISDKYLSSNELSNQISIEKRKNLKLRRNVEKGLNNPYASTGTPIDNLSGAAVFTSKLSNVGGGSKSIGGGGMEEGFKKIVELAESNAKMKTLLAEEDKKLREPNHLEFLG